MGITVRTRWDVPTDAPSPPRERWVTFGAQESQARNVTHRSRGGLVSVWRGSLSLTNPDRQGGDASETGHVGRGSAGSGE